jgi:hypothetical protein
VYWYYLALLMPIIAAGFCVRGFIRANNDTSAESFQFSLLDVLLLTFSVAVWMLIEGDQHHIYYVVHRFLLCCCAMLATQDVFQKANNPPTAIKKSIAYAPIFLAVALTKGLALLVWWAFLLVRDRNVRGSIMGARIAMVGAVVYAVAFFLPLERAVVGGKFSTFLGWQCYLAALGDCMEYLTISPGRDSYVGGTDIYFAPWIANVLLWMAWQKILNGRFIVAGFLAFAATYSALSLYGWESFLPAYHIWMSSMALTGVLTLIFAWRHRIKNQPF